MSLHPTSVQVATFFAVALICISSFAFGVTPRLPDDEVQALKIIANKMGKNWDTSAHPCNQMDGQITTLRQFNASVVVCDCSYAANTVCHVVSIAWKTQLLHGVLPPELVKLPFLRNFDITRNYLSSTIPPEWGAMQRIENISLGANRLIGPIPKKLGNLSTLERLVVEMNQLSGHLPPHLGNLTKIKRLIFTSNYFTGELPSSFTKLVTVDDLRLGDNNFTGQIPDFIQNFTYLTKLVIQASGLQGPIPDGIELLEKLTDLRISDLSGPEKQFPQLKKSRSIRTLILRSCNLSGQLPEDLPYADQINIFDVSFNKLNGGIPDSYSSLRFIEYLFLTGNQLSGSMPKWILGKGKTVDITYNNFTIEPSQCQGATANLFAATSIRNSSGIHACYSKNCRKSYYNLYINCGGGEVKTRGKKYDGDSDVGASSKFFHLDKYHWVYSTTGYFIDDDERQREAYIRSNESKLSIKNPELYMTARLSHLSLTYYAFCLMNGNYTLTLHFAEIMFTDDETYSSLGRRFFDVYVQGKVVLKDFNIVAEAGGAGKETVKSFNVTMTDNTLEIRFYWAGKGTPAIPFNGIYGPLISAISLDPNFDPPTEISTGIVVGIVIAVLCFVFLIVGILWWHGCFRHRDTIEKDIKSLDLKTGSFTLRQIKAATNNFDPANKIGEGGFGSVYKGFLVDGTIIAVKQLSTKSNQGNREFVNEIGMISALQHPHFVKLYGCCIEGNQLLLVYEYMENNSLARALFGPKEHQLKLDWPTRHRICVGIARGLAYLHEESRLKIVHIDIKATNVLLDKDLIPKISDFGLAKLAEEDNTHISTRIAGTFGYMAPEYAMRGYLTDKADVYSFGIVTLEIISGKCNTSGMLINECFYLLDWANMLKEKGDLMELVDLRLGSNFNKEEAMTMINVALLCTNTSPTIRPAMSSVVSMLEGRIKVEAPSQHASITIDEAKLAIMRKHFRGTSSRRISENIIQSLSTECPQTTSISTNDLYPVNLDSDYLLTRD